MTITVAAFYRDVPRSPSAFDDYLPFILAGQRALWATNPGARYVVITDRATAPKVAPHADVSVLMSGARPLVLDGLYAQAAFVAAQQSELVVIPDIDCIVNRDLRDVTPTDTGFAMTHKGRKFKYRINNCGYVRDMELGAWFLRQAIDVLEGWPAEQWDWLGDQEAWGAVAGVPVDDCDALPDGISRIGDEVLLSIVSGRPIHIYPNHTHNCPMSNDGAIRPAQENAVIVHFKGERKRFLDQFMAERFCA